MKKHALSYLLLLPCALGLLLLSSCKTTPTTITTTTTTTTPSTPIRYASAKPLTRWWWFASEINKQDIGSQLDWLKENGFGGVEVAWIYPLNRSKKDTANITPRQEWLGKEWIDVVQYCKHYGDSLGLTVDFTFGSFWPFGDLQVTPGESTKSFNNPDFRQWINGTWDYPKQALVIDHLSKPAFEHYASRMGKALEPAMKTGHPSGIFVDSWEVDTRNLWTDGFDSIFKARFGYDIAPFMKRGILTAEYEGQRYDYMKLISSLVINNFYVPFTEEAHRLGGYSRGQCSGSPTDLISAYAALDVPETEAMLYEPTFSRIVASSAALAGHQVVSSETFTCLYGWPREHMREEKVTDLKIVADAIFAHGVNQIFWHGTPYNTNGSDSVSFYATVHVGKAGALSPHLPSFNQYLTTVSDYMRKGDVFSDVAIYLPIEDTWIAGEMPKEKQYPWAWGEYECRYQVVPEEIRGYQPLWINGDFLKKGATTAVETKNYTSLRSGTCNFKSLYVDARFLDYEVLKTMVELAKGGFQICLKRKPEEAGYMKHVDFGELATKLVELSKSDWPAMKTSKPVVEGNDLPFFWCRKEQDKYYIFLAHPVAREFTYPVKYGQADTSETLNRTITVNLDKKSVDIQLTFKPYESILLEVSSNGKYKLIGLPTVQ